jgi:hypothetical protein
METKGDHRQVKVPSAPAPSTAMLEAATRYRDAWEAVRALPPEAEMSDRDLVEMHGAALALIWATGTQTLGDALALLHRLEGANGRTSS